MGLSISSATNRAKELDSLFTRLAAGNMVAKDISDDEIAKTHLRYLAGGRSGVANERLYTFEFPERPGALFKFLRTLRHGQSLSLFHYKNYGGDVARILCGVQCPDSERDQLNGFLKEVGYPFKECTDNETYKMFLRD